MRVAAIALLPLLACAEAASPLWVGFPPTQDANSMMLAYETGDAVEVVAIALEPGADPAPIRVSLDPGSEQPLRLQALLYATDLDTLGVPAGPLPREPSTEQTRAIPQPDRIYAAEIDGAGEVSWTRAGALSAALDDVRIPSLSYAGCVQWRTSVVSLTTGGRVEFAVGTNNGGLLVGTDDGTLALVTVGTVKAVPRPVGITRFLGAYHDVVSGEHYFGAEYGRLWRGTVTDRVEVVALPPSPHGGILRWIDGGPAADGGGTEIFTLSRSGDFSRFAEGSWKRLHKFTGPGGLPRLGGVARIGPGEAVAVWSFTDEVVRTIDKRAWTEPTPTRQGITAAVNTPSMGPVLATANGEILAYGAGGWTQIGDAAVASWIYSLMPYGTGFILGGAFGLLQQYTPEDGFCPLSAEHSDNSETIGALSGGRFAAMGSNPRGVGNTPVTICSPIP